MPIVTRAAYPYAVLAATEVSPEDGADADGYVFCHECGAHGPRAEDTVWDEAGIKALEAEGVKLWQERDDRNGDLYRSGGARGLNEYPRADG